MTRARTHREWVAAARLRVAVDRRLDRDTPQAIVDLANEGEPQGRCANDPEDAATGARTRSV